MRHTIKNENALPTNAWGRVDYLRSKSDPTVLIHGFTGDLYERKDGKPWKYPAVEVNGIEGGPAPVTRRGAGAYADHDIFPYDGSPA